MKKVIDYTIHDYQTLEDLEGCVRDHISDGWSLFGIPFVGPDGKYCQAMVKYEEGSDHGIRYA